MRKVAGYWFTQRVLAKLGYWLMKAVNYTIISLTDYAVKCKQQLRYSQNKYQNNCN